jgi:leucyl-tRNA synthetase
MAPAYDHVAIARRWRDRWDECGLYRVDVARADSATKFYNGVEFPYPSGEGLHVGHVFKYGGADVYGRYQRMRGRTVFQPIGFDAFGIHTENYALRTGEHPIPLTERTVARFREQLRSVGFGFDWSREIVTNHPGYYRWTQWVFLRLFEAGLAYRGEAPVLWCPSCLTVLAREQVEDDGTCERCDSVVIERAMTQWFLRTTAYRDRMRDGLAALDWPARAKNLQGRWLDGLRDWLVSRQRYWGTPIPIIHCPTCGLVPVPDDQLPVVLPAIDDFRPLGSGVSPLSACAEFVTTRCPRCHGDARRETDVLDTFVDSSWYFVRYPSTDVVDAPWNPDRTARLLPVDMYAGGPEHVTRHHLYARFTCLALHDLGLLPFAEPFPRLRLGGLLAHRGAKMSKSRGNVVTPDDYVARHGADVLRVALLFSARWDEGGDFTDEAVVGAERFLDRVWKLATGPLVDVPPPPTPAIGDDIERTSYNTAIARLMEYEQAVRASRSSEGARTLVLLLAPFAPFVTEELWERLGGAFSVHEQRWPAPSAGAPTERVVIVQVDGKLRARVPLPEGRRVTRVVTADGLVNIVTEGES